MSPQTNTTVRMFGALRSLRRERGLSSTIEVSIPPVGCAGCDLARKLDLPLEKIEAVLSTIELTALITPSRPGGLSFTRAARSPRNP